MFGGQDATGKNHNDVWFFDMETGQWTQLAFSTNHVSAPEPRFDAVGGFFNGVFWISCGQGTDSQGNPAYYGDLWGFDLGDSLWFRIDSESTIKPAPRWGLAGGIVGDQFIVSHGFATERYSDTLTFDLSFANTTQWAVLKAPVSDPVGRCLMGIATSPEELLMFGGCASPIGPCPLSDLWGFSPSTRGWVRYADAPLALNHADMAYWPGTRDVVLVGGESASAGESSRVGNTVHYFDRETNSWTSYVAESDILETSSPIIHHRMVAYQGDNAAYPRVVLFGGENSNGQIWGLFGNPAVSDVAAVPVGTVAGTTGSPGGGDGFAWRQGVALSVSLIVLGMIIV